MGNTGNRMGKVQVIGWESTGNRMGNTGNRMGKVLVIGWENLAGNAAIKVKIVFEKNET